MGDIIIVDEEFQEMAQAIKLQSDETEMIVDSLIEAFEKITTELAVEGDVADQGGDWELERTIFGNL